MKTTLKIILTSAIISSIISLWWTVAKYTDLINDDLLERWGNVFPKWSLALSLLTIIIVSLDLKFNWTNSPTINYLKSLKVGFFLCLLFALLATFGWSDSWTDNKSIMYPETREVADTIWRLGHPLTFYTVDLPIYLARKVDGFYKLISDWWLYPTTLILFIIQFGIYTHGIRMILNYKKIKTTYNNRYKT